MTSALADEPHKHMPLLDPGMTDRYTLRFADPDLEAGYREWRQQDRPVELRRWSIAAMVGFGALGLFEWGFLPSHVGLALTLRWGVFLPIHICFFWVRYSSGLERLYGPMKLTVLIASMVISTVMYVLGPPAFHIFYYIQLIVLLLFLFLHKGVSSTEAIAVGWFGCALFLGAAALGGAVEWRFDELMAGALLVALTIMGSVSVRDHELANRRYFHANRVLALEREQERDLQKKLDFANRQEAIGRLAGGIAHDFNNSLQIISGCAQAALNDADNPAAVREDQKLILKAVQSSSSLTRQLLTFGRQQPAEKAFVDVRAFLGEQSRFLRRLLPVNIELDVRPPETGGGVIADRGMLEQVLVNLCLNARDAMPQGGRLTIAGSHEVADEAFLQAHPWASPGRYVGLSISDTGTGMTPDVLERAFEPFFTTKKMGEGTGLGLATSYAILRQHDGMVEAESFPQGGSTFRLYLPLALQSPETAPPPPQPLEPVDGNETILLVEDNEDLCDVLALHLEARGYRVLKALDGEAAWRIYLENQWAIRLALLDVLLPKLSGVELFRRIRTANPGLPVVFSSGYTGSPNEVLPPDAAAIPLLRKPYDLKAMLALVQDLLHKAATLREARAVPPSRWA